MRTVKEPEIRRAEILDAAQTLFVTKGYGRTTIIDILDAVGIAKGTFYYHFRSKEEVMGAIIDRHLSAAADWMRSIALDSSLTAVEKLFRAITGQMPQAPSKTQLLEQLHEVENAQMHQLSLTQSLLRLTPVLTEIVEQGIAEGLFSTPCPKEAVEVIMVSSGCLFDEGLFHWTKEELRRKVIAHLHFAELLLGAQPGSFSAFLPAFQPLMGDGAIEQRGTVSSGQGPTGSEQP